MKNTIQPWIWMFLLPAAILFSLIAIGWCIKKIWRDDKGDDIAL